MAAAFFLLFYTFPSGMVLYWITNNLSALLLQMLRERAWIGRALLAAQAPEWRPWRG
jgi:membrane protein insertase Oxa1/YidC/SpoIIIJ